MTAPTDTRPPTLIAHRGDCQRAPENTLPAIEAALDAGAAWIEFDVQMSADGEPVLLHDADLRRTAGLDQRVTEMTLAALRQTDVSEPARLGESCRGVCIPALGDVVTLLRAWPEVTSLVEMKPESLDRFGIARVVDRVLEVLAPNLARCVVISYEREALERARSERDVPIGWIIKHWNDDARRSATALAPDYLVCNEKKLPEDEPALWPGPWRWVLYEAPTPDDALRMGARGAPFVETHTIGALLRDTRLVSGAIHRG